MISSDPAPAIINSYCDGLGLEPVPPDYTDRSSCVLLRRCLLTDRLSLTNALAEANIDRKAAERIATDPRAIRRMICPCCSADR